jgi:hypothetical protein
LAESHKRRIRLDQLACVIGDLIEESIVGEGHSGKCSSQVCKRAFKLRACIGGAFSNRQGRRPRVGSQT